MTKIKKGYHISITTWENDGDNYKTKMFVVDTIKEVEKIVRFIKYFYSCYGGDDFTFGNANYNKNQKLIHQGYNCNFNCQLFGEWLKESDHVLFSLLLGDKEDNGDYNGLIEQYLYQYIGTWAEGDIIRVLEEYKCYYVPEDIEFEDIEI